MRALAACKLLFFSIFFISHFRHVCAKFFLGENTFLLLPRNSHIFSFLCFSFFFSRLLVLIKILFNFSHLLDHHQTRWNINFDSRTDGFFFFGFRCNIFLYEVLSSSYLSQSHLISHHNDFKLHLQILIYDNRPVLAFNSDCIWINFAFHITFEYPKLFVNRPRLRSHVRKLLIWLPPALSIISYDPRRHVVSGVVLVLHSTNIRIQEANTWRREARRTAQEVLKLLN